ncbi:hypothetical protein [Xylophilus rhododendri]|uniref:hypothetical protein n=1 Tax=Xylophilus rhododendri TaxID=2697032 RepID=UPI001E519093|nr:hypothetical protein [Xylophilus rhododendri]
MLQNTDLLLLQARLDEAGAQGFHAACEAANSAARQRWPASHVQRTAWSPDTGDAYGYLVLPARQSMHGTALQPVLDAFSLALPADALARVSRLERAFERSGASLDERPSFHYVVEMDPEDGWREELLRWYDSEHMPGLASVPGCVRAARLLNHDHGPLSLACYDLVSQETLGSPPWLAVRASAWSSRVRPHFTNTRRTMCRTLGLQAPAVPPVVLV